MRTVVRGNEVPHLWIHQTQAEARNSNGSLYFNGPTIYSYGSHFPIARIYELRKGERVVLFTSRGYSNTTGKHKSFVLRAIPASVRQWTVPSVDGDHKANVQYLVHEIARLLAEAARARSAFQKDWRVNRAIPEAIADAKAYAKAFGVKLPKLPKLPKDWEAYSAKVRSDAAKEAAEKRKRTAAERAKRLEQMQEAIQAWQRGEHVSLPWDAPTLLRVEADEVVTSKGARVPLDHAKRALRLVRAIMASGREYQRNGHTEHVGNYAIDKITKDGTLHAGCHVIPWSEIERIAPEVEAA